MNWLTMAPSLPGVASTITRCTKSPVFNATLCVSLVLPVVRWSASSLTNWPLASVTLLAPRVVVAALA